MLQFGRDAKAGAFFVSYTSNHLKRLQILETLPQTFPFFSAKNFFATLVSVYIFAMSKGGKAPKDTIKYNNKNKTNN